MLTCWISCLYFAGRSPAILTDSFSQLRTQLQRPIVLIVYLKGYSSHVELFFRTTGRALLMATNRIMRVLMKDDALRIPGSCSSNDVSGLQSFAEVSPAPLPDCWGPV
jgi:hypothetical protein